jgi:lipid-A-disaccharide synthase
MKPKSFMLIAGEASGDLLAAELVEALHDELTNAESVLTADYQPLYASLAPRFFGAGGPRMQAAGVELAFDLTEHSVIGLSDVVRNYRKFRRLFAQLYHLALEREPDAIICVDFSGFNRRFAHAIRKYIRARRDWFHDWDPKIIQYVSPQVWASREGRAYQMAEDFDLLLSIFPFEKEWYAQRVPHFRVEFVGNSIIDRYSSEKCDVGNANSTPTNASGSRSASRLKVVLLPGSRASELARHLPVMLGAWEKLRAARADLTALMVSPNETLAQQARSAPLPDHIAVQTGGLPEALKEATLAIASTGTVTLECAYFGVPTVALYKTSWSTYQIGKRIVKVKYLAMPNLLANEEIFPEFIQGAATAANIAIAALELIGDERRRQRIKTRLAEIRASLGTPGASRQAARAVVRLMSQTGISPRLSLELQSSNRLKDAV